MEKYAIFLDLDGTLLTSQKTISPLTERVLRRAAEGGAYIIPATGRLYQGMPEMLRDAALVRYCVTVNGAALYDAAEDRVLRREEIPTPRALEIFSLFDRFDGVYDCYADNWGYMSREHYDRIPEYVQDVHYRQPLLTLRKPVEDFPGYVARHFPSIQKTQMYFRDPAERLRCIAFMTEALPDCNVTTSVSVNVEINSRKANKGDALRTFCALLGIPPAHTIAFGDNLNDVSMLKNAGIGVAMGNGTPEALAAADMVTDSNDRDGVGKALQKLLGL